VLIVCNGMPRSASTWSFNVVLALLRNLQPDREVYADYEERIGHFLERVPATAAHAVVKCHQLDPRGREMAHAGAARVIYTWRDPVDAVASCMRMFDHDFDTALDAVRPSLELLSFHRRHGTALILHYESITAAEVDAVKRIATYLGLDEHSQAVHEVRRETCIDRMKQRSESLPDEAELIALTGFPHDPRTLLHPNHIRHGGSGYGYALLTAQQVERVNSYVHERDLECAS
jgi:hypothetical protein